MKLIMKLSIEFFLSPPKVKDLRHGVQQGLLSEMRWRVKTNTQECPVISAHVLRHTHAHTCTNTSTCTYTCITDTSYTKIQA